MKPSKEVINNIAARRLKGEELLGAKYISECVMNGFLNINCTVLDGDPSVCLSGPICGVKWHGIGSPVFAQILKDIEESMAQLVAEAMRIEKDEQ